MQDIGEISSTSTVPEGPRLWALVPCAGHGSRAGAGGPKQYRDVAGRPVVAHTLSALLGVDRLHAVLVVLDPHDTGFDEVVLAESRCALSGTDRLLVKRVGGATRAQSVRQGLAALRQAGARDEDWVLVHDAARCLVRSAWVETLINACLDDPVGGLLAQPLADTLKQATGERSTATLPRQDKWLAQTPQMFRLSMLEQALDAAAAAGAEVTDEASALERLGLEPRLVGCSAENFKVTYPDDFARARAVLMVRGGQNSELPQLRIGEGWDVHRLVPGRPLVLGGVTIAHDKGLDGHSDADVLLHAVTDAVLGAAGLGDIGRHFPDTDARFAGADSSRLLAEAMRRVAAEGWRLVNVDATIIAQAPKLAPHMPAIRAGVAVALGCELAQVNIKAKTAERLGPVGRGEGMEANATCLLCRD